MKKNAITKIIASLAFFWILISIAWTGLLIIFNDNQQQELSAEQIAEIQKMFESQSWSTSHSWTEIIPEINISDEVNITEENK
jgi:preprotein translocase subunit SecG